MKIPITQVPQADELGKVILVVEAVSQNSKTDQEIADYVGFTDRQGRYYRLAASILGLLDNRHNNASLTSVGAELIVLDDSHRLKKVRTLLRENELFKKILEYIESLPEGVSRSELLEFLKANIDGSESTIYRRLNTIINWLAFSSLVVPDIREISIEDRETIYRINDQLDEADFLETNDFHDSIYPASYTNEELDIKENHMQVISLLRKKEQQKIIIPDFQRNQVWKPQQKSRFIESLILNIPIPPFYVSQDLDGKMIIVDGLQRSTAIFEFLSDKYSLVGLEALPQLNGISYTKLEDELKARIEDRELLLYILKPSVPMSIVYDIFNRINANGTPLTRQEIRNCIYSGHATKLLAKLSDNEVFKLSIDRGISPLRMKDREAILRFFAFTAPSALTEYSGDLDAFLGKAMRRINRMNGRELHELENRFIRVMNLTYDFFGNNNFRLPTDQGRGVINLALFEVISVFFDHHTDDDLNKYKIEIINNYHDILITDAAFRNAIKTATNNDANVRTRFQKTFNSLMPAKP